jgi:hypothetical protein
MSERATRVRPARLPQDCIASNDDIRSLLSVCDGLLVPPEPYWPPAPLVVSCVYCATASWNDTFCEFEEDCDCADGGGASTLWLLWLLLTAETMASFSEGSEGEDVKWVRGYG